MTVVKLDREDAVGVLTLSRAEMHNALNPELLTGIIEALSQVAACAETRALVLAADGPAFSIGGDMRAFAAVAAQDESHQRQYANDIVGLLNQVVLALTALPQPVIVAVHGMVTGGSLGLVAACDLAVMADDAVLKAHYVSAGFCPDGGWTALLPGLIGRRRAASALMLNRSISSANALDWGLVNEVAPASRVRARAMDLARKMASYPQGTLSQSKRLLAEDRALLEARLEAERQGFVELISGAEARNGVLGFLEKFSSYPGGAG